MCRSVIILIVTLFFGVTLYSQNKIIVSLEPNEFHLTADSIGKLEISITNNSPNPITVPLRVFLVDKNSTGEYTVGVKIIKLGLGRDKTPTSCDPSLDHILNTGITKEKIMPGETKIIQGRILGDCFKRKGDYLITFYFKKPIKKRKKYEFYSSNSIIIKSI